MYSGGADQKRVYGSRSRSRVRSVSDSRGPPPPNFPRGRKKCSGSGPPPRRHQSPSGPPPSRRQQQQQQQQQQDFSPSPPPPRRQHFTSSPSRSPLPPPVKRDAFGRNTAARQRYGEKNPSSSEEPPQRGRDSSYSRDRSPKAGKGGDGRMFPMGMPGMFPMGMGGKGMFPMMDQIWPGAGGEGGRGGGRDALAPWAAWAASMAAGGMPWPWPGFPGSAPPFQDSRRRGGSRERSRGRSRGRSRSRDGRGDGGDRVRVERSVMGRVIGKSGAVINDIRQQSGARIDAHDVNEDACEFSIHGSREAVDKAKTMITEIVEKVKRQNESGGGYGYGSRGGSSGGASADAGDSGGEATTENLDFPPNMTGKIIGARGAKIAEVRQNSGARIQVEKKEDKCIVQITGTPVQIDRAKAMIIRISEDPPDDVQKDDSGEVTNDFVDYGASATGAIIGTRGAKIAEIRQQSGARVQVEKFDDKCRVQISGTPDQIERAKKAVRRIVEESQQMMNRKPEAEEVFDVPQSTVGRVIGKGGETIQRIQRETGAHLDVNAKVDPPTVRITGSREAICHARFLINEIVDRGRAEERFSPPRGGPGYWGPDSGGPWGPGYPPGGFGDQYPQYQQGQGMFGGPKGLEDDRGNRSEIDMDEL